MEFRNSHNSYKPIKSHRLGNASRILRIYVESEIWMCLKIVKEMSLTYAGYISKIFNLFPTLTFYTTKPTGLS